MRCEVNGISIDISRNSVSAMAFAALVESADRWIDAVIANSVTERPCHLFKRSILLIKAWLEAEGGSEDVAIDGISVSGNRIWGVLPRHAMDSSAGGLSTAALTGEKGCNLRTDFFCII